MMQTQQERRADIHQLNELLRGEISAVETYTQAIHGVEDERVRTQLFRLRRSHAERVSQLAARVRMLGGTPADGAGAWGALTRTVEGAATMIGDGPAVGTLERGERVGMNSYERRLDAMTPESSAFIQREIMPAQRATAESVAVIHEQA